MGIKRYTPTIIKNDSKKTYCIKYNGKTYLPTLYVDGEYIDLSDWEYTYDENTKGVTLTKYIGSPTTTIVPNVKDE